MAVTAQLFLILGSLATLLSVSACSEISGLEDAQTQQTSQAKYPKILPSSKLPLPPEPRLTADSIAEIDAQSARLEQRQQASQNP